MCLRCAGHTPTFCEIVVPDQAVEIFRQTNFGALDWIIVAVYLGISVVIGLWVNRYVGNMTSYIGAGRSLGPCLGIATMTGTELGLITVMYSSQKGFTSGFSAFHIAVIAGAVCFLVGCTGFIVGALREHRVLTIPEFYEKRFSRGVRVLGGFILASAGILNMGLFLKVGAMFIVGVTGLSADGWELPAVMAGLLTLVLVYTVLGGMISVVLTDYVQFVVLSFGLVLTTILAIGHLGWDNIFSTILEAKGRAGFDPLAGDGNFGIEYVVWMAVTAGLVSCAVWPTAVARALAMESVEAVKKQYRWSAVSFMIRFMIPYFWGICAFVYITQSPELNHLFFNDTEAGTVNNLYAMPLFLGRLLPAGLLGLISAAMIAAFMSTHDSYLLCWSSVITQDIVGPLSDDRITDRQRILLTRVMIILIGGFILWWGLFYKGGDDIWDYMAVTGAIYFTGAIALLIGGLYWRGASTVGAYVGLLAGTTAVCGLEPVRVPLEKMLRIPLTGARVGLMTVALTIILFVVFSLLFPDRDKKSTNTPLGESA